MRYEVMHPQTYYRRNMPHIVPPGATLFITFRLAGSLPAAAVQQLQAELEAALDTISQAIPADEQPAAAHRARKAYFGQFDAQLDGSASGPDWLRQPAVAALVKRELDLLPELQINVLSYCIMPNHVHVVLQLPEGPDVAFGKLMQRLKGRTAYAANKLLGRRGPFWQHESYDHLVRGTRELARINSYVVMNPVKAGLVENWEEWPFTALL
ncbi:REP-associated tyrosine transposase [Hymenobacter daeguensis]